MSVLRPTARWRIRTAVAGTVAAVLAGTLGAPGQTAAAPQRVTDSAPPSTPAAPAGTSDRVETATFTLLTGDVVRMTTTADGTYSGEVVHDAGLPGDVVFQQVGDEFYALTGRVVRLIGEGRLDKQLFNLTALAEYGYDNASVDTLPVLTTHRPRMTARRAGPPTPTGARRTERLDSVNGQALAVDKDRAEQTWDDLSAAHSGVETVWLDAKVEASLDVSVPAVGAPSAWEAGYDGSGTSIAVLDTGIDTNHPDFEGRIAATRSLVPDQPVQDDHGHGTHVASIVAGSGAASDGQYRGVAPEAELVVGKVLDRTGNGQLSWVIEGMEWAAAQDVDVVNMSLGGTPDDGSHPLPQAVNRITAETGTLFVISAGNEGSNDQYERVAAGTVTWPGSADRALTVGSVAKYAPHRVSYFSSAGPRSDDHAIKPEITAPGATIAAARSATGTDMEGGAFPLGDHYAVASGTSMAAPHVAGAAAIVAQQHPNWGWGRVKDALVSTADPNDADPVPWQGGGMLDLAGATGSPLVATGTVHLGRIEAPHPETVSGEVTVRNVSDEAVSADLDLTLRKSGEDLVSDEPYTPPDGAVTVSPSTVDIPAGESTTVTVTVTLEPFPTPSSYHGWLAASVEGEVAARTTVGWTKSPTLHRLSIRGIDRHGKPANTTGSSFLNLFDRETGEHWLGYWVNGEAQFIGLGQRLPEGRYALLGNISDWTPQAPYTRDTETLISETELVLDQDRQFTFDAREANRVEFRTPRPSEPLDRYEAYHFGRRWVTGEGSERTFRFSEYWPSIPGVHLFPTRVEDAAGSDDLGRFETWFSSDQTPEDLTMTAIGRGGRVTLDPEYPKERNQGFGCPLPICTTWFESPRPHPIVDGGSGTRQELAAADVDGRYVLIQEVPNPDYDFAWQYRIEDVVAAARAAGAKGVLYSVSDPGPPFRGWNSLEWGNRGWTEPLGMPVAIIPRADGERLAAALERPGRVMIRSGGQPQASYKYNLTHTVEGPLPEDAVFELAEDQLATIERHYHADQPDTVLRIGGSERIVAPTTRTEYVVGGQAENLSAGVEGGLIVRDESPGLGAYGEERGDVRSYDAGANYVEHIRGRPIVPGAGDYSDSIYTDATLVADSNSLDFAPRLRGAGDRYYRGGSSGYGTKHLRYRYDGDVICERDTIINCSTYGHGVGRYQIELAAGLEDFPVGPTRTAWDVNVERLPDRGEDDIILPLVDIRYDVGVSLLNTVRAGSRYPITLTPGYQPGYEGDGEFTVSAWISHDNGETWTELGTEQVGDAEQAEFTVRTPRDAEHASLRVRAEDEHGNAVEQTALRAWEVTPRSPR